MRTSLLLLISLLTLGGGIQNNPGVQQSNLQSHSAQFNHA
jgi:hypothetical protein